MTEVTVVGKLNLHGKRLSFALAEDRVAHYPEFRDFFIRTFELDRKGLAEPGYVRAPSGIVYTLVFIGRSGEPFPSGAEIYADRGCAGACGRRNARPAICGPFCAGWLAESGTPWTVEDFDRTGRLYRVPAAPTT